MMEIWKSLGILVFVCIVVPWPCTVGLKFVIEPEDTVVNIGTNAVLNCQAEGQGPTTISWMKESILLNLNVSTDPRKSILANGSLHIISLHRTRETRPDEGLYSCLVHEEGVGTILSRSAKLQISSLSRFDEEPEDLNIGIGQTARFGCSAQGIPPPTVLWIKNNQPLTFDNTRMTLLPSGSLEITDIKNADEGVYQCNISNVDKFFLSRTGRLVLSRVPERDTPPVFTATPKSLTAINSQAIVLECSAVSYPRPKITWLHDGKTIDINVQNSRFSLLGEGNLMISNVEENDKGTYQCRAENREDSADVSATVQVHVPPKVIETASNFYAYEKEDIELPCKIYGKPTPIIQWLKNGQMIMEGDYFQIINGNNLKILGLVQSDAGMYQCLGNSPSGNVQSSMLLRVLKPGEIMPKIEFIESSTIGQSFPASQNGLFNNTSLGPSAPRNLTALVVSTRFVTLAWNVPLLTNGPILAYAIFYKELGSDRERVLNTSKSTIEEINVQHLSPSKKYTFRIVPYNSKGPGMSTNPITVETLPEVDIPSPPRFLKAWPLSPSSIRIEWAVPEVTNGNIMKYKVYFVEATNPLKNHENKDDFDDGDTIDNESEDEEDDDYYLLPNHNKNNGIQVLQVTNPETILEELRTFTEYFIWVVAINENGGGANSDQIKVTTLSDAPSDTPHNFSVIAESSTSLNVKWSSPPVEFRNGIITGYKLKYKPKNGKKRPDTITTDGNTNFCIINQLEKGTEYQIKITSININGSGPFTEWIYGSTFQKDLDETRVPDKPGSLEARPSSDSITIIWTPPKNTDVMIRGFTIGWGKGIPDVYTKLVEVKKRSFTIEKLRPNNDYVISLRAFNGVGDGVPIYENVRTRDSSEEDDEDQDSTFGQLQPPVGLRAITLSSNSMVLYWTDTSLPKTQVVPDNRYYIIRYTPTNEHHHRGGSGGGKKGLNSFKNTTDLNLIIDGLKPSTKYEFSVKIVKRSTHSEWSLIALNTTFDSIPLSPPNDLTLLALTKDDGSSSIILNWQPPKMSADEEVRGYLVFYTTNPNLKEWVEEPVPEDVLTCRVLGLTPDTTYYFRMTARFSKSIGPSTEIKSISTPIWKNNPRMVTKPSIFNNESDVKSNQIVLYILIALSITFALASVSLCIYYRKKGGLSEEASPKQTNSLKKRKQPELKPPDLWIHHDVTELKNLVPGATNLLLDTPMSPREFGEQDPEKIHLVHQSTNSLDNRNYLNYVGSKEVESYNSHSLGRRKSKPIKMPVVYDGGGGNESMGRNTYSRNSQQQYRSQQNENSQGGMQKDKVDHNKTYDNFPSGSSASSQHDLNSNSNSDYGNLQNNQSGGNSTLSRRSGLKSFCVPIPPMDSNGSQQTKGVTIRPVMGMHNLIQNSPIKRISTSHIPVGGGILTSPRNIHDHSGSGMDSPLSKCLSTEDIQEELSNLEGLMKDLNAINLNPSEFHC